jgi:hypothetical protein
LGFIRSLREGGRGSNQKRGIGDNKSPRAFGLDWAPTDPFGGVLRSGPAQCAWRVVLLWFLPIGNLGFIRSLREGGRGSNQKGGIGDNKSPRAFGLDWPPPTPLVVFSALDLLNARGELSFFDFFLIKFFLKKIRNGLFVIYLFVK